MNITRRWLVPTLLLALVSCVVASVAVARVANGGANIASAPTIVPGQQSFGNTTDGCWSSCYGADFWKLPLIAADQVTIDWETSSTSGCSSAASELDVWPIGTTDFSINNANPMQSFGIGDNNKAESKFTADVTGVFPIMFRACYDISDGGPYDFTVYVTHKVVVGLADQTRSVLLHARQGGTLPRRGSLLVLVHTADGAAISGGVGGALSGYWAGAWHKLAHASAAKGQIALRYALPATVHGLIRLSINIGGGNYQGTDLSYRGIRAG